MTGTTVGGYTKLWSVAPANKGSYGVQAWFKVAASGSEAWPTIASNNTHTGNDSWDISMSSWRGGSVDTANSGRTAATGNPSTTLTKTPSNNGIAVFSHYAAQSGTTGYTPTDGGTEISDQRLGNDDLEVHYLAVTAGASTQGTATPVTANGNEAGIVLISSIPARPILVLLTRIRPPKTTSTPTLRVPTDTATNPPGPPIRVALTRIKPPPVNSRLRAPTSTVGEIFSPFIASITVVYAPTLQETLSVPFIGSIMVVYAPTLQATLSVPFIGSITAVHPPSLFLGQIDVPFIGSVTVVYSPTLPQVYPPFIASVTRVFAPRLPSQPLVTNTFIKIRFSL